MAGAGYKLFNTGDVLTAAQVNTYLQEQTVMVFANSTARTTALSGVLAEGMVSYLQDTNAVEVYNGSAWVGVSGAGDVTEVQAGTGISVASGTGPIPVVTNTMATEITAKGDLIVGTGSGTFDNLPVGTNGYTLVADSAQSTGLKWAAASSGALTLIQRSSFSNVAGTGTTFDGVFTSTYKTYLCIIEQIYGTYADDLQLQFRYAGPTTQTTTYYGSSITTDYSTTSVVNTQTNNAAQATLNLFIGSVDAPTSGYIYFQAVGNASEKPYYQGSVFNADSFNVNILGGANNTPRTYTGFLLKSASSNVTGTVAIYGLATA